MVDEIVHPRLQAGAPVLAEHIGGQRHNRLRLPAGQLADLPRGLHAVHDGHLHIHQDEIERLGLRHFQRFPTIRRRRDVQADRPEQFDRHLPVDFIVLDQQDARASARRNARRNPARIGATLFSHAPVLFFRRAVNQNVLPTPGVLSAPA